MAEGRFGAIVIGRENIGEGISSVSTIANKPLISFSVHLLRAAGVEDVVVAAEGEHVERTAKELAGESATVRFDHGATSGAAVRTALPFLKSSAASVIVADAGVVTDLPLWSMAMNHLLHGAVLTALVFTRRNTVTEAKPGRPPIGADYIGTDTSGTRLLHFEPSESNGKTARVRRAAAIGASPLLLTADRQDAGLYIFRREELTKLEETSSLRSSFVPWLIKQQKLPDAKDESAVWGHPCCVFEAPEKCYCSRVTGVRTFLETNKDVASPNLLGLCDGGQEHHGDNWVHSSVHVGNKSNIGPGCVVGEGTSLGDKCSVKRSVLGNSCSLGNGCKVSSSVLLEGASVGQGSSISFSVLFHQCYIHPQASLQNCTVHSGASVPAGDHRDESFTAAR